MFISLAAAVKPTQVIDSGCEIRTPTAEYITTGETIKSHIHAINITTGSNNALTNDTTTCYLHLYNDIGSHLIEQDYGWDSNDLEWAMTIDGGNFTEAGHYTFYIQCTSSDSICAVSGDVIANAVGDEFTTANSIFYGFLLLILAFLFVCSTTGASMIDGENEIKDGALEINMNKHMKTILIAISYGLLIIISFLAYNVSYAYLGGSLAAASFKILFYFLMYALMVALPVFVGKLFLDVYNDKTLRYEMERGIVG